jgi:hypothetical protein
MAILVALEPFMFLSRKRWLRGGRGKWAVTPMVEDSGTIREEIPLWERRPGMSLHTMSEACGRGTTGD